MSDAVPFKLGTFSIAGARPFGVACNRHYGGARWEPHFALADVVI